MSVADTSTQPSIPAMGISAIRPYSQMDSNTQPKDPMPSLPTLPSISSTMNNKRKRQPSKITKPTKLLKKSASVPAMKKALDTVQDGDLSPDSDKKRNKLGYHRTSVACGHCRRRKIRCMMPDDDPSGRCSNCIRLKKDCNFYPVDQAIQGKATSGRAASAPKGHISSDSPTPMYLGSSFPNHEGYPFNPHGSYSLPPDSHHTNHGLAIYNAGPNHLGDNHNTYPHAYEQHPPPGGWHPSYQDVPPMSGAPSDSYNMSHQSPLPISPPSAPYNRHSSSFNPSAFGGETGSNPQMSSRNELTWTSQAPSRSISLSVNDPQPSSRYSYSPQPPTGNHDPSSASRRASSIPHPPPLVASSGDSSSTPSLSEPMPMGSMSAPVPGYSWPPNQWSNQTNGHYPPSSDGFNKPVEHRTDYPPVEGDMWYPDPINGY